mmetsp:Transcript_16426/g.35456  ORF Transcript_16426/g.35456 Transcript_16426/m.35456 type:complete len:188 (+) Transcript_16426:81-644(+)
MAMMISHNAVHNTIVLRQTLEKEARCLEKQGWVKRKGDPPSLPMPGTGVRLTGFSRRSDLNDREGKIMLGKPDEKGRLLVKLDKTDDLPAKHYRVSPGMMQPSILRKSASQPTLGKKEVAVSDISTIVPLPPVMNHEAFPFLRGYMASGVSIPPHKGFDHTLGFEVHKVSGQGRGYVRQPGGGFFAS